MQILSDRIVDLLLHRQDKLEHTRFNLSLIILNTISRSLSIYIYILHHLHPQLTSLLIMCLGKFFMKKHELGNSTNLDQS